MITITNQADWLSLLKIAEAGDNTAQYEVACHYDDGLRTSGVEIVAENKQLAFEWYYKAYKNGNNDAVIPVANFLSEGIYCDKDVELAIELYQKEIDKGSGIAANNLAAVFRDKQDYKKAFELYLLAQELDKSPSLILALCYYLGIGTERDLTKAFEILLKISEYPHLNCGYDVDEANYLLGKMYLEGEVVEKSISQARHFLKLADSDNDHRSAQELLLIIGRNE